ncbi:MAG: response regulator [Patescibacteria group bacterium]|jgi:DNA-binding response OmpR family regulator
MSKKKPVKKILIIEDDALLLRVLSETFARENFEIAMVENGLEAEKAAKDFSPDMILLDLVLPGLDGFAVLKNLKAGEVTKKIPVIILSNLEDVGDVKSTKVLGAEEYFIKANTEVEKVVDYVKKRLKV